jgi:hypothetical protein
LKIFNYNDSSFLNQYVEDFSRIHGKLKWKGDTPLGLTRGCDRLINELLVVMKKSFSSEAQQKRDLNVMVQAIQTSSSSQPQQAGQPYAHYTTIGAQPVQTSSSTSSQVDYDYSKYCTTLVFRKTLSPEEQIIKTFIEDVEAVAASLYKGPLAISGEEEKYLYSICDLNGYSLSQIKYELNIPDEILFFRRAGSPGSIPPLPRGKFFREIVDFSSWTVQTREGIKCVLGGFRLNEKKKFL